MKNTDISKLVKSGLLAASLILLPATPSALAQTEDTSNPTVDTTPFQESEDDPGNWGWLGLIGLVGLANLFRKPKTAPTYQETDRGTDVASGTGYRE